MKQEIKETIEKISPPDQEWLKKAQVYIDNLVKPVGSLGRLEEFAAKIVAIQQTMEPSLEKKRVVLMAGDHGVVDEGISLYPQEVTCAMVGNFIGGGAAVCVLARHAGADVTVVDMGVAADLEPADGLLIRKVRKGTDNFAKGPAMSVEDAEKAILTGIEIAKEMKAAGARTILTGDMGIGNTTPSAAVCAVITGMSPGELAGRGTGLDDEGVAKKAAVIEKGIELNKPDAKDAIDVLSRVGGLEIAGLCGLILGGCAEGMVVVVDGFISTAGLLAAWKMCPTVLDLIFPAHRSAESGHSKVLEFLKVRPILDLDMRLGEGTGAIEALHLLEASMRMFREMSTFSEAGVKREE
ncbi:MAG: nicotinate-nucleotide--dimethylbenzimidazole phosphoribosyltransferase [bacterium]